MKRLLLPAALALLSPVASADIGLGASLRDTDVTLFLPIEPDEILRVEPFFAWSDQDVSGPGTADVSSESLTIGVGLFRKLDIHDRTRVYFGARAGFNQFKQTSPDPGTPDRDADTYSLEPTLGLEYRIVDQVTVSFEALLYYRSTSEDFAGADFDTDTVGTANRILLRAYFPP